MDREPLLTTAQAARALGISRRALSRYAQTGQLQPTLILPSGHYRWDLDHIRAQLQEIRVRHRDEDV